MSRWRNGIDDWGSAGKTAERRLEAAMNPSNVLFLMSDEHTREVLGCYGNRNERTPNLDRLAASETRFDNAYTPFPVCVSAR